MSKRYSRIADDKSAARPAVNEANAQPYSHKKERGQGIRAAASIATVKRRLRKPVKRTRRDIAWALDIVGIGDYAVYDCATPSPRLVRVRDPFGSLLAKAKGSMLIGMQAMLVAQEG